jgi:large subunit ribosomal protein L23
MGRVDSSNPYSIILHPVYKEKTMLMRDNPKENKLEFIVDMRATRSDVKKAIEKMLDVRVESVNIRITKNGKRAVVKFAKGYSAEDIGIRLGIT